MRKWVGGVIAAGLLFTGVLVTSIATGPEPLADAPAVFSLEEVRALAGGGGPTVLRAARVIAGRQPELMVRVGGGWGGNDMPVYPLQLSWPSGRSILIEPASDADCSEAFLPAAFFDAAAHARMVSAMHEAEMIVATHEHFDHVCGLTRAAALAELAPKARLTAAQIESAAPMTGLDERSRSLLTPLALEGLHKLAPGVVLIEASGHTPGSLWVYIRTQPGEELLLVGDTLWTGAGLTEGAPKPYLPMLVGGEDIGAQRRLQGFLMALARDNPSLRVLVAHDGPAWEAALAEGVLEPL